MREEYKVVYKDTLHTSGRKRSSTGKTQVSRNKPTLDDLTALLQHITGPTTVFQNPELIRTIPGFWESIPRSPGAPPNPASMTSAHSACLSSSISRGAPNRHAAGLSPARAVLRGRLGTKRDEEFQVFCFKQENPAPVLSATLAAAAGDPDAQAYAYFGLDKASPEPPSRLHADCKTFPSF